MGGGVEGGVAVEIVVTGDGGWGVSGGGGGMG